MVVEQVYTSSPRSSVFFNNLLHFLPRNESIPVDTHAYSGQEQSTAKKRRALIVDDVADVTEMLCVLLTHADYAVETADSAAHALASARQQQFDIVISDIGMPEMDGYQLVQMLRSIPGYEKTPMVAVTGYSMFNDREKSLASGFNAHMTKPIDPRALLDLIEQL